MEPAVEPLLKNLITRNAIRLTLVDMPFSSGSILYARYFLYALNENDFDHALKVRTPFFSHRRQEHNNRGEDRVSVQTRRHILPAFEPKLAFNQYNDLIKEDHVDSTPSCVIVREGKKKTFVGGGDVVNALRKSNNREALSAMRGKGCPCSMSCSIGGHRVDGLYEACERPAPIFREP